MEESVKRFSKRVSKVSDSPKELDSDFMELLKEPVLNLHERKIGKYEIVVDIVPAGKELTVVSARNWIMMGYKMLKIKYENHRPLFKLIKDGHGLLMSDSPQEMFLQYDAYKNSNGKVLVGGLGLGLYANMIAKKDNVTEVVVIEKDSDVIKLIRPFIKGEKIRVINDDIPKFIKETKESFDYVYIDIHYSTGATEYKYTVLPLRKMLDEKFPRVKSDFWGEEEMKTQYFNIC